MPDGSDGALVSLAEQGLELGEHHLDRVQVGAVGRQEEQVSPRGTDGAADGDTLVAAQVVEHDDVTWLERRDEELLDPGEEDHAVDGAIDDAGGLDSIRPQRGKERHSLPVAVRHAGHQALSKGCAAMGSGHVGLGPGLVHKDEAGGGKAALVAAPALTLGGDVGPMLFGGVQAFF